MAEYCGHLVEFQNGENHLHYALVKRGCRPKYLTGYEQFLDYAKRAGFEVVEREGEENCLEEEAPKND